MPNTDSPELAPGDYGVYISSAVAILKYEAASLAQRDAILAAARQVLDGVGEFADAIIATMEAR